MLASSTRRIEAESVALVSILVGFAFPRRNSWLTVDRRFDRMGAPASCFGRSGAKSTGMRFVRRRDSPTRGPEKLRVTISALILSSASTAPFGVLSSTPLASSPCNGCAASFLGLGSSTGLFNPSVQNPANSPPRCDPCAGPFVSALPPGCHGSVNPTNDAGTCTTPPPRAQISQLLANSTPITERKCSLLHVEHTLHSHRPGPFWR
jgi:hypothetical protein